MTNWDSYRDDLDTLKSELENLIEARNDVMWRIKIAEEEQRQQPMKPTTEVQLWLSSVQAVETEADEMIKQASEEIEKFHPGGFCFWTFNNMSSSYEFKDTVADKLQAVTNLINEGAVLMADEVLVVTTLKDEGALEAAVLETIPEDEADDRWPIVGMESIINKVWKCLKKGGGGEEEEEESRAGGDDDDYDYEEEEEEEEDDNDNDDVRIIGVYGMGGVGKTSLLKQINKKLLQMKNDFDIVIWVVVSRDLQLDKIQQQIGEKIGLFENKVWKHKNFEEKASDISKILEEKKFVLLMDDLWERVDLTKVGVPLPSPENSSKIVFTTRSLEICSLMEADKLLKVMCLPDEEAWKLFQALVGEETLLDYPVISSALRVCEECYGLPLALVSIGRTMANKKTPQEWSDVMSSNSGLDDQLKKSVYYNLKLSYDSLPNDIFKLCLLYCCLFPRNDEISKRDLIDCWIGEGFLDDRLGAQSQGYYIIDVLLSTCLLEEGQNENNYVKMHNWIHDMSLWIASEIVCVCTFEAPEIEKWENVTRMSVINNTTWNLTVAPKNPHLQTLFFYKNDLQKINSDFFQIMASLKVLNLSNSYGLTKFPLGVSNLVSLQHLDLSNSDTIELPNQLGALKKLKCLNLEKTSGLRTIPRQLISKFSVLHVLRLWECGFMLQSTEDGVEFNDAQLLIEELLCLKNLSMLSISLKNSHALQRLLSSNRLQSCTQSLCLQDLSHPKSIKVSLTDLKHLNTLEISECDYLEELEVDFGIVGEVQAIRESPCSFYLLGEVIIYSCPKLRDMTWLILAPNLKHLEISDCDEMEEIINGGKLSERPERMGKVITFSKLKFLTLKHLPKLRSIYWSDLPFPDLKELAITDCPMLLPLPPHLLNKVHVLPVEPSSVENPADRSKQVIESGGTGKSLEVPSKSDSGSEKKHIKERVAFRTKSEVEILDDGYKWRKYDQKGVKNSPYPKIASAIPDAKVSDASNLKASAAAIQLPIDITISREINQSVFEVDCIPLWGSVSICGRRPEMEDAVAAVPSFMKIPIKMLIGDCVIDGMSQSLSGLNSHFFGVYDGHGGSEVANYCSERIHFVLAEEIEIIKNDLADGSTKESQQEQWEKTFTSCFLKVDDEIGGNAGRSVGSDKKNASEATFEAVAPETVGSTAVVALVCSSHIIVANCGNSRAVLCRGKEPMALSIDHKLNREDEYARIEASGGKIIQWNGLRLFGVLEITRSIGDRYLKPWIIPEPEIMFIPRARDDECLILASDGLWDVMSNKEACEVARRRILLWHKKNGAPPLAERGKGIDLASQAAADYLSMLALQKGSRDNISVIVVDLKAQRKFKSKS